MLLSIELSMVAIIFLYIVFSYIIDDIANQAYAILILTVAAAETVVGLILLINFINLKQNIHVDGI